MRIPARLFLLLLLLLSLLPLGPAEAQDTSKAEIKTSRLAEYVLPYPTGSFKLLQGFEGPYGHQGHAKFAYDFQMPIGSTVIAARGGEVVKVVKNNSDGTRVPGEENVVVIKHSDGTFARYYHLTKEGALVSEGSRVAQGDKIGLSGNSGASAGPHLHFDVTKDCFDWGCQTIPLEFSNTKENPLKQGQLYAPLNRPKD